MRIVNDKELAAVFALSSEERLKYLVKRVADSEEVWSLWSEAGWALAADDEGNEIVPIWPSSRFAQSCAAGEWLNAIPKRIELDRWLTGWTEGITRDKRLVAVFPSRQAKGIVMQATELKKIIEEELKEYE